MKLFPLETNMAEFGLVDPFENDTLDFCLGVEWEIFRQRLKDGDNFMMSIHAENAERLARMCDRHQRYNETLPCPIVEGYHDDHFTMWRCIHVGAKIT